MVRGMMMAVVLLLSGSDAVRAQEDRAKLHEALYQQIQTQFAAAYNKADTAAMAALFTEDAVRITPSGIFQGRAAIRRNFEEVIAMGLHDYTVRRTVSRNAGELMLNAGEWQAMLGDTRFRGYYSALLTWDGDQPRIVEETVNVAAPR